MRRQHLCNLLLAVVLFAFLSVFSTAATHFHKSEKAELACPICHLAGHQSLSAHIPALLPVVDCLVRLLLREPLGSASIVSAHLTRLPPSRAPPR